MTVSVSLSENLRVYRQYRTLHYISELQYIDLARAKSEALDDI